MKLGEKFRLVVKVQDYQTPVSLVVKIKGVTDSGVQYDNNQTLTLKNDQSQNIVFDMKNQELGNYWLQAKTLDGKKFSHIVNLHLSTKKYSVFIQTDKAIYKPGDKVQFRVLVLDSDTRPFVPKVTEIFIADGAQNRIKQFDKIVFNRGVFQNELQLSDEPVMGTWTIHVKVNNEDDTAKTFDVAEYVLPKFEVIITTKRNVKMDEKILVNFAAKYTYGKQVTTGTAIVTAELADNWWNEDSQAKLSFQQELGNKTNVVEFDVVRELKINGMWDERDVKITVSFKDGLTGAEQNASTIVTIHQKPYKVELIGNHDGFKPGLSFIVSAVATDLEGIPVADSTSPVTFRITYTYDILEPNPEGNLSSSLISINKRPIPFWRPPHFVQKTETIERFLENGEAKLALMVSDNVTSLSITVS